MNRTQQRAGRARGVATTLFPIAQSGELDAEQLGKLGLAEPRQSAHRAHVDAIGWRGPRRSRGAADQARQSLHVRASPGPGGLQKYFEDLVVQLVAIELRLRRDLYASGVHTSMAVSYTHLRAHETDS